MIRKTLTTACAAMALAGGLAAPAFADASKDIITPDVFFNSLSFADGLDMSGQFGNTFATTGAFDEVFLFFSAPIGSQIAFDGSADYANGKATVSFTSFDFGVFNQEYFDEDGNVVGINGSSLPLDQSYRTKFAFGGESADFLDGAVYYIEVKGTALVAGGGFGGDINTTAVPEPANVALMLAGLGLVGTLARRRKRAA